MEFTKYPKTPRLFRNCVITEKIDGTNAAVVIEKHEIGVAASGGVPEHHISTVILDNSDDNHEYWVGAQSRNRLITPEKDNAGFAAWVRDNASELVALLGEGVHFGEWWGKGIQRGYGLDHKRFSLFNTGRWSVDALHGLGAAFQVRVPAELDVVPVLWTGTFSTSIIQHALEVLALQGSEASQAVTGEYFPRPEGVVVYHTASGQVYKALIENDDRPKGLAVKPDGWKGEAQ